MTLPATLWIHLSVVGLCAIAALTDTLHERIPNWLTLPALGVALVLHTFLQGPMGALDAALGAILCGAVPAALFWAGAMGGGDVKLLAAIGALVGYRLGLEIQLLSFVVASVYALGMLTWHGHLWRTLHNTAALTANAFLPRNRRRHVPQELMSKLRFGVPMLVATVLVLFAHSYVPSF
jgi:prepilin peptidase CpaA